MININIAQLKELNACQQGIVKFIAEFPDGISGLDWTREKQKEFLLTSPLKSYFGWAVSKGLLPMWSFEAMNLERADLQGADLAGLPLKWANLKEAHLTWPI